MSEWGGVSRGGTGGGGRGIGERACDNMMMRYGSTRQGLSGEADHCRPMRHPCGRGLVTWC